MLVVFFFAFVADADLVAPLDVAFVVVLVVVHNDAFAVGHDAFW